MQRNEIVQRTTEYILGLPDKTDITMYQAVMAACPESEADITDTALFDLLDEIVASVEKTGTVLDFSAHDGKVEGLPFNLDFIVRKKWLQKAQIISDLMCYGPCPEPEDAIEQRLTISANGRVWFTEYLFGEIDSKKRPIGRQERITIGKAKAAAILSLLADYCETQPLLYRCTDIGDWYLTATAVDGTVKKLSCSLCGGIVVGDVDLTDYIREQVPINDLAVFGGGKEAICDDC